MTPIQSLKQLRADLGVLEGIAGQLRSSREASTAFTKMQETKMHVGNTLFELRGITPYVHSKDASNATIEKYHIDEEIVPMAIPTDWNQDGLIQNVKILRRELDGVLDRIKAVSLHPEFIKASIDLNSDYAGAFLSEAFIRCRETQNWYGMELGRLRDTQIV